MTENHPSGNETVTSGHTMPLAIEHLLESGYIETNSLFSVTIANHDNIDRYDLIHPGTNTRLLWTPESHAETMDYIEQVLGTPEHPIFPSKTKSPLEEELTEGDLYELDPGARSLSNILVSSPYVPEYMDRITKRAENFMWELSRLDKNQFGIDLEDVIVNHNSSRTDDIFLSIVPPISNEKVGPHKPASSMDKLELERERLRSNLASLALNQSQKRRPIQPHTPAPKKLRPPESI